MRNFWLYLGTFLACSSIKNALGTILVLEYILDDLKSSIEKNKISESKCNKIEESDNTKTKKHTSKVYDQKTREGLK